MNITLRTPLISREEQLRNQYNYQMQTFNNEQSMDLDANSAQQSPVKAVEEKQFLCEELFMRLPTFNPDNYLIFIWRCLICFFCIWYFYLIPVFMFFDYRVRSHSICLDRAKRPGVGHHFRRAMRAGLGARVRYFRVPKHGLLL